MVFIFESHPVQYRAPLYQCMQKLGPDSFRVIYFTDCSVRGHRDREFGELVAWDTPLLSGYPHVILSNERGVPLDGFRSLTGRGVYALLRRERPRAVIFSQFLYEADLVAYLSCLALGIPIWLRHETQDEAFRRPAWKERLRSVLYRVAYYPVKHAFYIGRLNREHLVRHGLSTDRLSFAPYGVSTPASDLSSEAKQKRRDALRTKLGLAPAATLVLFSGKLIEKKNPRLILQALPLLSSGKGERFEVAFVGSGELAGALETMAAAFPGRVHFTGFVNQSEITDYYLAADILVLPSRRAGETWGLVVNEALHAGCAVVMTEAVGCHREFGDWERVRVIREGDAGGCAEAIRELSKFPRSFDWCAQQMEPYGVRAAAEAMIRPINGGDSAPDAGAQ